MASPGNPTPPGGGPFDMHKLFKPSTPPPASAPTANPNHQNFTNNAGNANSNTNLVSAPFPPPSASYPPPTGAGGGPYSYSPNIPIPLPSPSVHPVLQSLAAPPGIR
ncbi:UNVERIFIED_CONTAM: hypothetical protein Sradi_2249300 [Sesamum radiatum]|uniref:Uncharacterized protein n=1 Tax=Sesamum radiatum TaxID=300843 RepID=A0AAW2T3T9_SESRA